MILQRIWQDQPGKYFCISTKSGSKKWRDNFFSRGQLDELPDFIQENSDKDIYFCPHGFTQERRVKEYAVSPKLLWSDLDERDPRLIRLRPTIAIESSPGRFVGLWRTDQPTNEELNRRLSYSLGADKSGWDLTQVLRVPGTINYKYNSLPKTRLLWSDGPRYSVAELERELPGSAPKPDAISKATEIFSKYEKAIPAWCRREIMSGKPTPGKRSEMLWKLEQTLIEAGVSTSEAFELLRSSPWNKFADRRGGDRQLKRELSKAVNGHMNGKATDTHSEISLAFRSMDQVEEENIDWIYYPYFALGELTIVEGDPGLGKSYLMQMISGAICDGRRLPSIRHLRCTQGKVVYFDMENSAGTVTKKRLVSNDVKHLENFIQCEEPFSIDNEKFMDEVYDYLETHRPVMVVFDTVNTYLGKADAFKGHEAQQAFMKFREMSKRFNCSVVVLRHLTKSTKERALYRGQGNIAFAGVARVVLTIGTMPDDPETRVMAVAKINVARTPKALTFTIESIPDTLKESDRSRFKWGDFCEVTADEIVAPMEKDAKQDLEEAIKFLTGQLENGPAELHRLEKMAEARSMSMKLINRAATKIGVKKEIKGFGKARTSFWSLAEATPSPN